MILPPRLFWLQIKKFFVPAMNVRMWLHKATQKNLTLITMATNS